VARTINGFTLIEIVVVIAIMAIALSIAIPNFSKYVTDYQISSQVDQIYSDLQLAKFYSVSHRVQTTFRINNNSYTISYLDSNNNLQTIKAINNLKYPVSLNVGNNTISFDSHGFASNAYANTITIYINQQNSAKPDCINITYTEINTGIWSNNVCSNQ